MVDPGELRCAQAADPDQGFVAEYQWDLSALGEGDFCLDEDLLDLFAAVHAERDNAVSRQEGADMPGKWGAVEVK